MGRQSVKKNKSIYQLSRENAKLSREEAGFRMKYVTEDRLEKIENGRTNIKPEDVLEMARCYNDPLLCNKHCSQECPIGKNSVRPISEKDLAKVTTQLVKSINSMYEMKDTLIELAALDDLPPEKMDELIFCGIEMNKFSNSLDSLKLWMQKKLSE